MYLSNYASFKEAKECENTYINSTFYWEFQLHIRTIYKYNLVYLHNLKFLLYIFLTSLLRHFSRYLISTFI